jgi:hypothetical protein
MRLTTVFGGAAEQSGCRLRPFMLGGAEII